MSETFEQFRERHHAAHTSAEDLERMLFESKSRVEELEVDRDKLFMAGYDSGFRDGAKPSVGSDRGGAWTSYRARKALGGGSDE